MISKDTPAFSVIMPTYNRAFCLCNAIDSLLAQTYQNFDFIIVNDCSNDETKQLVLEKYKNEFEVKRVLYTEHKENLGLNASRNTGAMIAKNDWILFWMMTIHFLLFFWKHMQRQFWNIPNARFSIRN